MEEEGAKCAPPLPCVMRIWLYFALSSAIIFTNIVTTSEKRQKENVTWSKIHGGGWGKIERIPRRRDGGHLAPSSTMIFAPCHILLTPRKIAENFRDSEKST